MPKSKGDQGTKEILQVVVGIVVLVKIIEEMPRKSRRRFLQLVKEWAERETDA